LPKALLGCEQICQDDLGASLWLRVALLSCRERFSELSQSRLDVHEAALE
jgi:hypothetical protein